MIVDGVVVHERWYANPIERVWEAITDPAALATWLMPNDATLGSTCGFVFDGGDRFGPIPVEVVEQDRPVLQRTTWQIGARWTEVSIRLTAIAGGTAPRLEHRLLDDAAEGFDQGWAAKLDQDLAEVLDGQRLTADATIRDGFWHHPVFDHSPASEDSP